MSYKCHICSKEFKKRLSNYRSHMKKHEIIIPYKFSRKRKEPEAFDNLSNFSYDLNESVLDESPKNEGPKNER